MSARRLKVYRWQSSRSECPRAGNGSRQTVEILATTSKKKAAEIAGERGPWALFNLGETGNEQSIAQAMSQPGVIFWRPVDGRGDWVAAGGTSE